MIKKIIIIVSLLIITFSCGKKGNPSRDGEEVISPRYKNI